MWRDRLDVFWDGGRALAIGFFDAETVAAQGLRPELVVAAAAEEELGDAELVDVVDATRWRCGCQLIELPQDRPFVSLRSADGAELRLALAGDKASPSGGEWRLLLAELPEGSGLAAPAFRVAALSARGDFERLTEEQVVRSGPKLLWALGQRRQVERRGEALVLTRLWPSQRVFPLQQSRIAIEAPELEFERNFAPLRAPFAIMEHWLQENGAPCARLRLRFPSLEFSEGFLSRVSVFLVMHQRRAARDWARRQRENGGAIADLLGGDDIRRATGRLDEKPEAAETTKTLIVHNLLKLCANESAPFDGVAIRRESEGGALGGIVVDVAFYAAALGDDVGLVSTSADAGDFEVAPFDPGGARYARVFRFGFDGLWARPLEDEDPLLDEILRLAAEGERAPGAATPKAEAEKATGLQARRASLFAGLNNALASVGFAGRLDATKMWDALEPFQLASFLALVTDTPPAGRAFLQRHGGYDGYRADPALMEALARQTDFAPWQESGARAPRRIEAKSLAHRYAAACGLAGAVAQDADLQTQIDAFAVLRQGGVAKNLLAARISLDGPDIRLEHVAHAAELLANEAMAERAAIYCDDWEFADKAAALRAYLERRRAGEWTYLGEAEYLAGVVEEADAYWREVGESRARAPTEEPPEEKPAGIFAAVRSFFLGEGQKAPRA